MPQKNVKRNEPRAGLVLRSIDGDPRRFEEVAFVTQELDEPMSGWSVRAEFALDEQTGEIVHRSITFAPVERAPFGSLTQTTLRRMSLLDAFQALEDVLRRLEAVGVAETEGWIDALTAGRRPGRGGQDPNVYLLWARRRVEAEQEAPDRPIKWLVERYGADRTEQAINKLIYTAREKGFLTPADQPVDLTPRAKRLVAKGVN